MSDKNFYSLPFRAEKLVAPDPDNQPPRLGDAEKTDLLHSIFQNLRLLFSTRPMRLQFDPDYGCNIHWSHFSLDSRLIREGSPEEDRFKIRLEQNIRTLIEKFEPRIKLDAIVLGFEKKRERKKALREAQEVKNVLRINVKITGVIKAAYTIDQHPIELEDYISLL